jgi:hypothetical protein
LDTQNKSPKASNLNKSERALQDTIDGER